MRLTMEKDEKKKDFCGCSDCACKRGDPCHCKGYRPEDNDNDGDEY